MKFEMRGYMRLLGQESNSGKDGGEASEMLPRVIDSANLDYSVGKGSGSFRDAIASALAIMMTAHHSKPAEKTR